MKTRFALGQLGWLTLSTLAAAGCGDGENDLDAPTAGSAGSTASAGASGTPTSGGSSATGGNSTGGSSPSGGAGGTAGGNAQGGSAGTGTSGSSATGGSAGSSSGAGGGNAAGKGGSAGTPNATGGSAGSSASGAAGSSTGGGGGAVPTSGCNAATWPPAQTNTLMVEGTTEPREFIVALPEAYDPAHPYRLAFAFHGRTGTAEQIAGGFGGGGYYGMLSRLGDSTILVSPQGLGTDADPEDTGWPNTGGRDIEFVRSMIAWLSSNYCIDQTRIFSAGMSYGGIMSNTIGCEMPDVFRGIAPIAGAMFGRGTACQEPPPIAVWMTHGTEDETVTFDQGEGARDTFLAKNGCDTALDPTPVEPEGCVSYQGCAAGYPVVWCVHDGGHIVPAFSAQAISDFFEQF